MNFCYLYVFHYIIQMLGKSNKKQVTESSSLAALTQNSEHSQVTKKAISTQQISLDSLPSQFERQSSHYHIDVPFQINIKSLIKHLRMKMVQKQNIFILFSDEKAGQILIQEKPKNRILLRLLDCLCICRKQGWPKKAVAQTFQAVSITIKRQYIQQKCTIGIKGNFSRSKSSNRLKLFIQQSTQFIRKALQTFKDMKQYPEIKQINYESPLGFQINAVKKVQGILIQGNSDKRLKTLYDTSVQKIQILIKQHPEGQATNKIKLSQFIQMIVTECNSIFTSICNTPGISQMGLHQDYTLYAIENMLCYTFLKDVMHLYRSDIENNCIQFFKNCKYINKNLSNSQYFDYLQVRQRYRLPKTQNPYGLAVSALRKLENSTTLRQMLLCVQHTFSLIKICCLSQHKGKIQISSMDDILPVMIFVVAKAQIQNFPAYVKIIDDYIRIRGVFELEERVITTLYVATQDICKKLPKSIDNK